MTALFYVGLALFAVGMLQVFQRGPHWALVGTTLPLFLLGAVLVSAGQGEAGRFFVYLFSTCFLVVQLLKLSTRKNYYFHLIPFAVLFGGLVGFLADFFRADRYFVLYLALSVAFLLVALTRQLTSPGAMRAYAQLEKEIVSSVKETEVKQQLRKELRPKRLVIQHVAASVIAFAVVCGLTFYFVHGSL